MSGAREGDVVGGRPLAMASVGAEGGTTPGGATPGAAGAGGHGPGHLVGGSPGVPPAGAGPEDGTLLGWRELAHSWWSLFRLSSRIVLRRKVLFMAMAVVVYYGLLYALLVYDPGSGFSVELALFVLVQIPGTLLAIYLAMDLVAKERDRDTLEPLYSTRSSHYLVWGVRLAAVHATLLTTLMAMSGLGYVLFAEYPWLWGGLNAFLAAFLVANLTFWLAVGCRSSNTAGMLALGFVVLTLLFFEPLQSTLFDLYLNPFQLHIGIDEGTWVRRVWINRCAVAGLGVGMLYLGLRRMEGRERLLS